MPLFQGFIVDFTTKQESASSIHGAYVEPKKQMLNPVAENTTQELGESSRAHIIRVPFVLTNCDKELM